VADDEPTREQLVAENARLAEELERVKRQAAALLSAGSGEEQERQLERYREYRHFFEKGAPIHVVIAADGTVEDANESFLKCFGYTKQETIGLPVLELVSPEHRAQAVAVLEAEFSGRQSGTISINCLAKDGSLRRIRSSGEQPAAAVYRNGQPVRIYATFIDVTHAADVLTADRSSAADRLGAFTALDWIAVVVVALLGLGLMLAPLTVGAAFAAMFRDFGGTLPGITQLALSPAFPAVAGLLVGGPLAVALLAPLSLGRRRLLCLVGFLLGAVIAMLYVFAMYAPIFELSGSIEG